jgi:hypothetical protein
LKQKFAPQEWHLLKLLPCLMFNYVGRSLSGAKKFEMNEAQFGKILLGFDPNLAKDPLHREVATDTPQSEWTDLVAESLDPSKIERSVVRGDVPESDPELMLLSRMLMARDLLNEKLIREQYQSYLTSVLLTSAFLPFKEIHKKARKPANDAQNKLMELFSLQGVPEPT